MKNWMIYCLFALVLLIAPAICRADTATPDYFKASADPLFNQPISAVLQKLVDNPGIPEIRNPYTPHKINHFCILGENYYGSDGKWIKYAEIYWLEGRAILHWVPIDRESRNGNIEDISSTINFRDYTHLDKDVVPTQNEIGGSDYLVDRTWVDETIKACKAYDEEFTITSHRK